MCCCVLCLVDTFSIYVAWYLQHVIIGLDNTDVFADLDLAAASSTAFAQEEGDDDSDEDDDDDSDDEYEEVVKILHKVTVVTGQ
jgi:hypothetical protein